MAQTTLYSTAECRKQKVAKGEVWHPLASPTGRAGWYLKVTPKGSWYMYRYVNKLGKQKKLRLCDVKATTFEQAAEQHLLASRSVEEGTDLVQDARDSKAASRTVGVVPDSMSALCALWLEQISTSVSYSTFKGYECWVNGHIVPVIGRLHPHSLKAIDVKNVRDRAHNQSVPTSLKVLRLTKQLVKWGVGELYLPVDVAAAIPQLGKPVSRTAYLSTEQYQTLFQKLEEIPTPAVANVIRLLAYTGCRRNEVTLLEHSEVQWGPDRKSAWILLPAARTKMTKDHNVYICPAAAEWLRAAVDASTSDKYVFSGKDGKRALNPNTVSRQFHDLAIGPDLVLHSLRHAFQSHCHKENMAPYQDIEAAIGHSLKGAGAIYTHSENLQSMKPVWVTFGKWLTCVLNGEEMAQGGKVVELFG